MSDEKIMRRDIKEFLKKVKEKLPEWLKEKKEHKEILTELEEHIWDRAVELSEHGQATEQSVRLALAHMGTPHSIAQEYKRRGTPKVYISEELWPLYTRWVIGVISVIIILSVVGFIISVIVGDVGEVFGGSLIMNIMSAFAIITIIFVALSMEGYFPEDFKSKKQLEKEKQKLAEAKEKGIPISKWTGKPLKPIVKPAEKIAGGIVSLIFGALFLTLPIPLDILNLIDPGFIMIIRIAGVFIMLDGCITLIRGILGPRKVAGQQATLICMAVLKFASLPLFIWIMNSADIFPIIYMKNPEAGWQVITIPIEYHEAFRNIWIVIIAIHAISATYDIYKSGSLVKYKL